MHYIIGAKFAAPGPAVQPVSTGVTRVTTSIQPAIIGENKSKFNPSTIYTLFNIEKNEDSKFQYTFNSDTGETVSVLFDSPNDGDQFIARARGEQLPDYDKYYSNRND